MGLRSTLSLCLCWAAPLHGCESADPEPPPPTWTSPADFSTSGVGTPLSLRCDWVDGTRVKVEVRRDLTRNGRHAFTAEARWRMSIAREGRATLVRTTELSAEEGRARLADDRLNAALTVFNFIPSSRWTPDLETLELIDTEATGAMLEAVGQVVAPPALRTSTGWSVMAPMFANEAAVMARQADNQLGGMTSLDGMTFAPGEVKRSSGSNASNLGIEAVTTSATHLTGMGPCFEGDSANGCVSVEVTVSVDAQAAQAAMGERAVVRSLDGVFRMLLEPATLMPHRVTFEKSTGLALRVGDELREGGTIDEITWVYRYPLPRAATPTR